MNCAICSAPLEARPELKTVVNPARSRWEEIRHRIAPGWLSDPGEGPSPTIQKHVRTKPRQIVITVRAEGSSGPEVPTFRGYEVRLCTNCAHGKDWLELLAVWLDRALEGRPR